MAKKLIPGIVTAAIKGAPILHDIVELFKKKPKTPIEVLNNMPKEELVSIVKEHETKHDEPIWQWVLKRGVTLATVYFVVWTVKQMGVTYQDIMSLFGLF